MDPPLFHSCGYENGGEEEATGRLPAIDEGRRGLMRPSSALSQSRIEASSAAGATPKMSSTSSALSWTLDQDRTASLSSRATTDAESVGEGKMDSGGVSMGMAASVTGGAHAEEEDVLETGEGPAKEKGKKKKKSAKTG
jgi:hypothetical protein